MAVDARLYVAAARRDLDAILAVLEAVEDVAALAVGARFSGPEIVEMPTRNPSLVVRRPAAPERARAAARDGG